MTFIAFLDAVDKITVLVDKEIKTIGDFKLAFGHSSTILKVCEKIEEHGWFKYILGLDNILDMTQDIYLINGDYSTLLYSGSFVRDDRFDIYYGYDGPLGVYYNEEYSIFRIWSPVAREIKLELYNLKGDISVYNVPHIKRGLHEIKVMGNLDRFKYRYRVRVLEEFKVITDPYGIASDANGNYSYVVDKNKFRKFTFTKPNFDGKYTNSIIYEVSVRDLTSNFNIHNKMQFSALTEKLVTSHGKSTCLDYIAKLGVTHVQFMPIFDFYGISDKNPERYYNWGYNPIQYFVPKGAYSSNPDDPYARINELINMVDYCHAYGLLANMDVVFNHVNDIAKFPFDALCPGYFYRTENGYITNVSGCGNDLATERMMCSRFIVDNLIYMTETYHFSGYRFDLMGLLDINTMQEVSRRLRNINPKIMLYGEGWDMPNALPDHDRPHSRNHRQIPDYAFFNDRFRDYMKGSQWHMSQGFIANGGHNDSDLFNYLTGSCNNFLFQNPGQSINYIECHDNYTVYDYLKKTMPKAKEFDIYESCKLGLALVILSFGVPFIHSGQEFLRTKNGVENSYNSPDSINAIDWERKDSYYSLVQYTRDLILLRKRYKIFRCDNPAEIKRRSFFLADKSTRDTFVYRLIDDECDLIIIIKTNRKEKYDIKQNDLKLIFDSNSLTFEDVKRVTLREKGLYILRKEH